MTPEDAADADAVAGALGSAPEVLVGYVFGSVASGTAGPASDLDVAVLTGDPISPHRRLELLADLQASVRRRVDLVLLQEAPPALGFRVLRDGVAVLVRDEAARVRHHAETLDRYFDTEPLRRELDQAQRRRIQEGSFGRR
jgi:predicted nucleotidyltransferase